MRSISTFHRAAAVAAILAAPVVLQPLAAQADTCSTAYHAALAEIGRSHGPALAQAAASLRQPVDGMAGRWITGAPIEARGKAAERPCLETAVSRGRERCVRYGVALPREVEARARATAEEQRAIAQLAEIVRGRGVPAEFAANGRSTGVVLRVASEVRNYLEQASRPALCTGGREVTQFYLGQLDGISRRMEETRALAATTRTLAAARVREAVTADVADLTQRAATPPTTAPATPSATAAAAPRSAPTVQTPEAYAERPALALVGEVARSLSFAPLASPDTPKVAFDAIRQSTERLRSADLQAASPEVRGATLAALRMIEARLYGEALAARYQQADAALMSTLRQIRAAHDKACTCAN